MSKREVRTMYTMAKVFSVLSWAGLIVALCCIAADLQYSSIIDVLGGILIGGAMFLWFNTLAHRLTLYLYKNNCISKDKVIRLLK